MLNFRSLTSIAAVAALLLTTNSFALAGGKKRMVTFKVRIENVSSKAGLPSGDAAYPFALSPGMYSATSAKIDLFKAGRKADPALESQAEDGDPESLYGAFLATGLRGTYGIFNTPVGAEKPAPILPEEAYEFSFAGSRGMKLNLIAMYGQSNDLFYAPAKAIDLFDKDGNPLSGDITSQFLLWDAGTEVNEAPGVGAEQAPRQKMKNSGPAENGVIGPVKDAFTYPATGEVLRITITAN